MCVVAVVLLEVPLVEVVEELVVLGAVVVVVVVVDLTCAPSGVAMTSAASDAMRSFIGPSVGSAAKARGQQT